MFGGDNHRFSYRFRCAGMGLSKACQ
jgi:hypothetical protein